MKFSIIIPLEFHRGLAERCIGAWTRQQTLPRDQFELLLAAPERHDAAELRRIAALLAPQDKILRMPFQHDMPLAAEAARQAQGEVLVFTEAHCLPEPDFLEQSAAVLAEQPDWAGFSGRSIPATHNLLSEIEAEMYGEDIARNLEQHPWLKVLDQCFIIRRDAYAASGGIEPQFGHFAEWVLAARLHRRGLKIGFDPRPAIHHYYVGDLHELEEFTLDFAAGQMRFAQQAATDPCRDLFDEVPEWSNRFRWHPQVAADFVRLFAAQRRERLRTGEPAQGQRADQPGHPPWQLAWTWFGRRWIPRGARNVLQGLGVWSLRAAVNWHLRRGDKPRAKAAFLKLMSAWVHLGRRQFLAREFERQAPAACTPAGTLSEWMPRACESLPCCGFHGLERRDRLPFRWSEPAAMLWLPQLVGRWRISIAFATNLAPSQRRLARFFLNEQLVPAERIVHREHQTELEFCGTSRAAVRLAWTCPAFPAPGDARQLGLPVSRVSWVDVAADSPQGVAAVEPDEALYFLHVPKCAGTATRQLLMNAFPARDTLAAHNVWFYYARQLPDHEPEIQTPYAFASGHFGWELPARVADRRWRIVTVLREPVERLLSLYDYLRQHGRLPQGLEFGEWIEQELLMKDLMLAYFVPDTLQLKPQGLKSIAELLPPLQVAAEANLRTCRVVGLQERMADSVNLLCAATGSLPPPHVSRVNATLNRTRRSEVDANTWSRLTSQLSAEFEFHRAAESLFHEQLGRLHEQLAREEGRELDTAGVRGVLRQRYFARRAAEALARGPLSQMAWSPDDGFPGHNLHDRERHGGQTLRWTGPSPETTFYFPLERARRVRIELQLHPATPHTHAEGARLIANGQETPLRCEANESGYLLTATFDPGQPPAECGLFSEFRLITPTVCGVNEFRTLGVALQSIRWHTQAAAIPAPHLQLASAPHA